MTRDRQRQAFKISRHHPVILLAMTLLGLILALFWPPLSPAQSPVSEGLFHRGLVPEGVQVLEGVVIRVVSAGEMVLWQKGKLHPFTLYGLEFPPPESPEGEAAKKEVSDMIFNTLLSVYLMPGEADPPAGIVVIQGTCMNQTLARSGTAKPSRGFTAETVCRQWKGAQNGAAPAEKRATLQQE